MFERFTGQARRVLVLAQEDSRERNCSFITTENLLVGLSGAGESTSEVMSSFGLTHEAITANSQEGGSPPSPGSPPFTPDAKRTIEFALRQALGFGHSYISPAHLLLGLIQIKDPLTVAIFEALGVSAPELRQATEETLEPPTPPRPDERSNRPLTLSEAVARAKAARDEELTIEQAIGLASGDLALLVEAIRSATEPSGPAREAFFSLAVLCELAGLSLNSVLD
jgi:ATP-dependent Clp protease ATP-binding subunit ClpA